jgi:membrane protease YdiL (CAAX protease family)
MESPVVPYQGAGLASSAPNDGRRAWSPGEVGVWAAVLVVAGFLAALAVFSQMRRVEKPQDDASLRMMARYAMGVHLVSGALGSGPMGGLLGVDSEMMKQLDGHAETPQDQLRVAVMAGELAGREEALRRLNALAAQEPQLAEDVRTAVASYGGQPVDEQRWEAFRAKYDWFADLLASAGKAAGDAERVRAIMPAYRTVGVLLGFTAAALPMGLAGLVLLIIGIVLVARGRLKRAFFRGDMPGAPPADRRSYLYGFGCYLLSTVGMGLAARLILLRLPGERLELGLSLAVTVAAFGCGLVLPLLLGQTWAQWRTALGLHTGRGLWREIGSGIAVYLAGIPLLVVSMVVVWVLTEISGLKGTHPITEELRGSAGKLIEAFVAACILAPVTEELMFRGALFAHLRERFGWWISAPAVAFVFAIIHPQGWVALPALGTLAVVFAAIREWRGSIIGCMAAHAVHNGVILLLAVLLMR